MQSPERKRARRGDYLPETSTSLLSNAVGKDESLTEKRDSIEAVVETKKPKIAPAKALPAKPSNAKGADSACDKSPQCSGTQTPNVGDKSQHSEHTRTDQIPASLTHIDCSSPPVRPALEEIIAPPNSGVKKSRIAVTESGSVNSDEND